MANIINDPAFKKKLEQMTPQVPPLSGEVELPNLGQIAQQTAQQVLPQQPLVSGQQSRAESIREGAMDIGRGILSTVGQGVRNIAQAPGAAADVLFDPSRPSMSDVMSERGMRTIFDGGDAVTPQEPPEGVFTPAVVQSLGEATRPPAQLGQTAGGTMEVEPQVGGAIAPPQVAVPPTEGVAPQVPQMGGAGITKDGVFYPTQQPTGELKTFEDRLKSTIAAGEMTPQMKAQAAAEASPSASPEQVALAQEEAATRQANIEADRAAKEYGDTLKLDGGSLGDTIADREAKIAKFRDEFIKKQGPAKTKTPEEIRTEQFRTQEREKKLELLDQKIEAGKSPDATPADKKAAARAQGVKDGTITQAQADEANKQDLIGKPPMGYATWAQYEYETGTDADGDRKVATKEDAVAAAPTKAGGMVNMVAPDGRKLEVPQDKVEDMLAKGATKA